jgi:hypothetical protein
MRDAFWIGLVDLGSIVAKLREVGKQAGISTLVKQKLHTWGGGVRFSATAW